MAVFDSLPLACFFFLDQRNVGILMLVSSILMLLQSRGDIPFSYRLWLNPILVDFAVKSCFLNPQTVNLELSHENTSLLRMGVKSEPGKCSLVHGSWLNLKPNDELNETTLCAWWPSNTIERYYSPFKRGLHKVQKQVVFCSPFSSVYPPLNLANSNLWRLQKLGLYFIVF